MRDFWSGGGANADTTRGCAIVSRVPTALVDGSQYHCRSVHCAVQGVRVSTHTATMRVSAHTATCPVRSSMARGWQVRGVLLLWQLLLRFFSLIV